MLARTEAIRRLVELGLKAKPKGRFGYLTILLWGRFAPVAIFVGFAMAAGWTAPLKFVRTQWNAKSKSKRQN